jgi:S1-C subfamily serine protease
MKPFRVLLLVLLLVGCFYLLTMHGPLRNVGANIFVVRPDHVQITEAAAPQRLNPYEENNIAVYHRVEPSVVNVTSHLVTFDFFYGAVPEEGQGSGVIIDSNGDILTNYHVVQGAQQLEVTLSDKRQFKAAVVGTDEVDDIAVIQIRASNLQPATLGDSKNLEVGQEVYAIGNPFGLSGSMTRGIISSLRPVRGPSGHNMEEAIQTDAAINPGNSGGPLLDSHGNVIGINTFILSQVGQSAGIGFAIPINVAKAVLGDLISYGRVRRPSLGIRTLAVTPDLAQQMNLPPQYGLLILQVIPGSAAQRAGLRGGTEPAYLGNVKIAIGGDFIVAVDGREIQDQSDLQQVMNRHKSGDAVRVTFYRGNRKMEVDVTLGEAREQQV